MPNSRFGYSVKKNSFKGLNIDCVQYSNIIRITYYSYSYSGTILNPNIIRIRIRPNICARILFVFVFAHSEKTNIIRIRIRSKFWFRILFVFIFGPKNSICSPLYWTEITSQYYHTFETLQYLNPWWWWYVRIFRSNRKQIIIIFVLFWSLSGNICNLRLAIFAIFRNCS